MKQTRLLLAACMIAPQLLHAQVSKKTDDLKKSLATSNKDTVAWVHSGIFTFGANEGFLHNWAAGGEIASLVVNSVFQGNITYFNHSTVWSNNLVLAYGLNYTYSNNFVPRKTDDRINFTSNYGTQIKNSKNFFLSGVFDFKSQFTDGYDYTLTDWQHHPTSDFMSPAYLTLAAGMEYRKGEELSLFLSPAAAREILAARYYTSQSAQGAFGIDSGKTSKFQFGAYFSGRFKRNLSKSTLFTSRLDLYSNYLAKNTTDPVTGVVVKKDNPGNIQVYWDNLFAIKAYKNFSVTFGLTLFYDNNFPYSKTTTNASGQVVDKNQPGENWGWVQVSQIFTLGLAYKF